MARVDPPAPVHTRPYGPARPVLRPSVILRYAGNFTPEQGDKLRQRVTASAPDLDVLLVDDRWTVAYPLANHESTAP